MIIKNVILVDVEVVGLSVGIFMYVILFLESF